jgi:hypothetical protein
MIKLPEPAAVVVLTTLVCSGPGRMITPTALDVGPEPVREQEQAIQIQPQVAVIPGTEIKVPSQGAGKLAHVAAHQPMLARACPHGGASLDPPSASRSD